MGDFWKRFDRLLDAGAWVAAGLLLGTTFAISADILLRFTIGKTFPAVIEFTEYGLMTATFLGAPWVLRESAHVKVDFIIDSASPRVRMLALWLVHLLGLAICVVLLVFALKALGDSRAAGNRIFKNITLDEWWTLVPICLSFALMVLEFARRLWRMAYGLPPESAKSDAGF